MSLVLDRFQMEAREREFREAFPFIVLATSAEHCPFCQRPKSTRGNYVCDACWSTASSELAGYSWKTEAIEQWLRRNMALGMTTYTDTDAETAEETP